MTNATCFQTEVRGYSESQKNIQKIEGDRRQVNNLHIEGSVMNWAVQWSSRGGAVFGVDLASVNAPHHKFFSRDTR